MTRCILSSYIVRIWATRYMLPQMTSYANSPYYTFALIKFAQNKSNQIRSNQIKSPRAYLICFPVFSVAFLFSCEEAAQEVLLLSIDLVMHLWCLSPVHSVSALLKFRTSISMSVTSRVYTGTDITLLFLCNCLSLYTRGLWNTMYNYLTTSMRGCLSMYIPLLM